MAKRWGNLITLGKKLPTISRVTVAGEVSFDYSKVSGANISKDDLAARFRHTAKGVSAYDIGFARDLVVDVPPGRLDQKFFRRDTQINEPFLWVRVDWGSGELPSYYSTTDRANGARQLYGKVISVGTLSRSFADGGKLQRAVTQIVFRDTDREFSDRLSNGDWLRARFTFKVGFRTIIEQDYWPISQVMRVDQILESTGDTVSLQLIDAIEDIAGDPIRLLPLGGHIGTQGLYGLGPSEHTMRQFSSEDFGITQFDKFPDTGKKDGSKLLDEKRDVLIPIPFNGEMHKVPFAYCRGTLPGDVRLYEFNPIAAVVLGASRSPGWAGPNRFVGDCDKPYSQQKADVELWYKFTYEDSGTSELRPFIARDHDAIRLNWEGSGVFAYVETLKIDDPTPPWYGESDFDQPGPDVPDQYRHWYVSVLYLVVMPWWYQNRPKWYTNSVRWHVRDFKKAAEKGDVWVRLNRGADHARPVDQVFTNPAEVIETVIRNYTLVDPRDIRGLEDAATARDLADVYPSGAITEDKPAIETIEEIAGSFNLDLGYDLDGQLLVRPMGVTIEDLRDRIPNAVEYNEDEILEGTFKQWTPVGDQRGGISTAFTFDKVKDYITEFRPGAKDAVYKDGSTMRMLKNRYLERELKIGWRPQAMGNSPDGYRDLDVSAAREWASPYTRLRDYASFSLPLHAALERLGGYCRVTNSRAIKREGGIGWESRLCRVEGITLNPMTFEVELTVYDCHHFDTSEKPYILDDEDSWVFEKGNTTRTVSGALGGTTISLNYGASGRTPEVGMFFEIPLAEGGFFCSRVSAVTPGVSAEIEDELPVALVDATEWEFQFSDEAPLDEDWGGSIHYGPPHNDSRLFGRLCDEDLPDSDEGRPGAFADGDSGYTLEDD